MRCVAPLFLEPPQTTVMIEDNNELQTADDGEEELFSGDELYDFQNAVIELAAEYNHLPVIGIVGALHTAAHVITAASFASDEEEDDEGEDEEGEDEPLAVSYALDELTEG